MQNIVIKMCDKFHYDQWRNDKSLENGKSGNNNNILSVAIGDPCPLSGSKNL